MRRHRLLLVVGGLIVAAIAFAGLTGVASAADVQHGISFTKGCASPTQVGAPYSCTYSIRNNVDEAKDTLTINGLNDTVHAASGNVSSGNVFSSLKFEIGTPSVPGAPDPSCVGGTGNGQPGTPFTGASSCTIPFGSRLNVLSFSFYTVQASDFNLPGHVLTDSAELTWHDLCNDPGGTGNSNCVNNPPVSGAGSQTLVNGLPSTTATTIHNAAHGAVTTVAVGTTVHDLVTVSRRRQPDTDRHRPDRLVHEQHVRRRSDRDLCGADARRRIGRRYVVPPDSEHGRRVQLQGPLSR
jgi:hypothetical protein